MNAELLTPRLARMVAALILATVMVAVALTAAATAAQATIWDKKDPPPTQCDGIIGDEKPSPIIVTGICPIDMK